MKSGNIVSNTPNDGAYSWTIPSDISPASDYYIVIEDVAYGWSTIGTTFKISNPKSSDNDDSTTDNDDNDTTDDTHVSKVNYPDPALCNNEF